MDSGRSAELLALKVSGKTNVDKSSEGVEFKKKKKKFVFPSAPLYSSFIMLSIKRGTKLKTSI